MNFSKLRLLLALLLAAVACTALRLAQLAQEQPPWREETGTPVPRRPMPTSPEAVAQWKAAWLAPVHWVPGIRGNELFASQKYLFFPATREIKPYSDQIMFRGMRLSWLLAHGLDYTSPTIETEDPDGDGFTNREEYGDGTAPTDPRDPTSHPPFVTRLRLAQVERKPWRVVFRSKLEQGGRTLFELYFMDAGEKASRLAAIGDVVGGFKVCAYRPSVVEQADASELDLEDTTTGEKITLARGHETDAARVTALFVLLLPGKEGGTIKARPGQSFSLPPEPGTQFRLLTADERGARLAEAATSKEYSVPPLTQDERNATRLSGAGFPLAPQSAASPSIASGPMP